MPTFEVDGAKCLTIIQAGNGFIVEIKNHGKSDFQEPYFTTLTVHSNFDELVDYLESFLTEKSKE